MNRAELLDRVCVKLGRPREDFVWSALCGNPETMTHNEELGTNSMEMGYYVLKTKHI